MTLPDFEEFSGESASLVQHPLVQHPLVPQKELEHARLQYLIDNTPAIIYASVPTGDFKMTFVSSNAINVLGFDPAEMV